MISECLNELNSEDYTEFIIRNSALAKRTLDNLEDYCVTELNEKWSIVSVRAADVGTYVYESFSYAVFPLIYGLSDMGAVDAGGVTAVRMQPVLNLYGTGTYVAIIDTGINWRHEAFRNNDGSTKISVIWDQQSGIEYTREDINEALMGNDIDIPGDEIGHGTYMAGIACGNAAPANSFSGVAPFAGIIVVKIKQCKDSLRNFYFVRDDVPAYSETDIMRAVQYVSDYAEKNAVPVSVCIGLGTTISSHSGATPLANMLADEAGRIGRCITTATGNQGNERLHFHGEVRGNEEVKAEIRVGAGEKGFTMTVWSKVPESYSVAVVSPSGQYVSRIPVRNRTTVINFPFENTTMYVYYRRNESLSSANLLAIRMERPAEGIWTFFFGGSGRAYGSFDAWIMNREFLSSDTYFIESSPDTTITDPGNTIEVITVSSYDYRDGAIALKNGRGYNWYGAIKPDFAAPGVRLTVPNKIGSNGYTTADGSSIAAAYYSGMAALYLEYGIIRGNIPYIRTSDIKNITISGCREKKELEYPNREWGYGTVDIYNSLERLRQE